MSDFDTLLFPVFNELRKQGVPLGVQDYLLAVKAVRAGAGLESLGTLKQLCCLLWAKSREDQERLDTAFSKWIVPKLQAVPTNILPHSSNDKQEPSLIEDSAATKTEEIQRTFHLSPADWLSSPNNPSMRQSIPYHLTPRLPIDHREMVGLWRQLRRQRRVGTPEELDVEGTLDGICQTGYFLKPILKPRRRNQAKLVLLIDQQGSMVPFSPLVKALIESIMRSGLLKGMINLYYFHDCPELVLFEHPNLRHTHTLEEILSVQAKDNSVLIVSDAGAARGYYDRQRVISTRAFLKNLSVYTYLYAWLNPMPSMRWKTTTAEDIACIVPMFSLDREGLNDAIDILRGHPFPPGVNLDA